MLLLASTLPAFAVDIKVPAQTGPTTAIQEAIDVCPASDCRILLQGSRYELANSLLIRNKTNLVLTSASTDLPATLVFQDDGTLAGPDNDPDSLALKPSGWKRWPVDGTAQAGGSLNTTNPYSLTGIFRNGMVLVQGSTDVVLENLVLDGVKPIAWGSLNVFSSMYPTFFGNVGLNLWSSRRVTLRSSEIRNCFAAVAIRNPDTATMSANDNGLQVLSLDRKLSGEHRFENNRIHHGLWAVWNENRGLPSRWTGNRLWELHNTASDLEAWASGKGALCYTRATASSKVPGVCDNSNAKIHVGGFQFVTYSKKTDSVWQNTFWRIGSLVSNNGWGASSHKDSLPLLFWNNLLAEPWYDYNADTSGLQSSVATGILLGYSNLATTLAKTMRSNTWAWFPKVNVLTNASVRGACFGSIDSCKAVVAAEQAKVWPAKRLSFMTQNVQAAMVNQVYETPSPAHPYIDGLQYQGQERGFPFQLWNLETVSSTVPKISYTETLPVVSGRSVAFSWQGLDSNVIAQRFGRIRGLPDADTVGRILKMGADSSLDNHYAKSIPMDLDETSPTFLMPKWTDAGVDSVVVASLWAPTGTVPAGVTARGAVQPSSAPVGIAVVSGSQGARVARAHGNGWLLPVDSWKLHDLNGREIGLDVSREGHVLCAVPRGAFKVGVLTSATGLRIKVVRP